MIEYREPKVFDDVKSQPEAFKGEVCMEKRFNNGLRYKILMYVGIGVVAFGVVVGNLLYFLGFFGKEIYCEEKRVSKILSCGDLGCAIETEDGDYEVVSKEIEVGDRIKYCRKTPVG